MKTIYALILSLVCLLTGCQSSSKNNLKVAATSIPHAEILEFIKPDLQVQGIDLSIIVVEDYHTPNRALNDHEVDANFFQHQPFLEFQKQEFGYQLENLTPVHLEPMALYSKKIKKLSESQPSSVIALPNDPANQLRALLLLEKLQLITLNRHDNKASILNIEHNPQRFQFIEMDSPLLSRTLDDVSLAAITTNFALQAGLSPQTDALAQETADSLFVNIIAIRSGESSHENLQALKTAITSEKVKQFIKNRYQGAIIPAF